MRVFAIAGFSGTGKTSLVEAIVKELVSRGFRVTTIKSSQHEPKEGEGTDTDRHLKAGAQKSHFYGPSKKGRPLKDIINSTKSDFLIVEGMKTSSLPKIWCVGDNPLGDTIPTDVKAILSWKSKSIQDKYAIPILQPNQMEQIISIILNNAIAFDSLEI